ncbi:ThiF family adenylyltransferase [Microbacterium sp. MYb66]|uniref:ThiF family adenylyltransferase n=1 Tax=Microbacterium sp. MYb66 TaxID=1848692 RepID=UPI000CFFB385|nr:ThiF family adenylyltransferase [Microbacterium sp. MYb66]PRA83316.1 hypothetical protein CQ045_02720 [Microbacterium sp. MYb66]
MSIDRYDDFVAYARMHFEEGLLRAGFATTSGGWIGSIMHGANSTDVIIALPSRFPFVPPRVVPAAIDTVSWSWHRERDGALCLVAEDDHDGLWWVEPVEFLQHISAWFEEADAGWPEDRPDLDLERYFDPSPDRRVYLYDEITDYLSAFVRFRPAANNTMMMVRGTRPRKARRQHKDRYGYVVELENFDTPPRSWSDLAERLPNALEVDRKIRDGSISIVLVVYRRSDQLGVFALDVSIEVERSITARSLISGSTGAVARNVRAGILAPALGSKKVAIVGVGAIGSFIADALVRSGVRNLTLIDADIVLPGNLIRHLVGPSSIGLAKVEAVSRHIIGRYDMADLHLELDAQRLDNGADAVEIITTHDLVVNASAEFATTALLHVAAESVGQHVLSVALLDQGATYRVDVLPPFSDVEVVPPLDAPLTEQVIELFDSGCGSPISPTPPHAVMEAAAAAARHVIGILSGRPIHDAGESRSVAPQGEIRVS